MDKTILKLAACAAQIIAVVMKKKNRKRKIWVKKWLLARENKSVYNNLFQELRVDDAESYRRYLRMNTDTHQELLQSVTPKLEKRGTTMRKPLSVEEKLICTLRFLLTPKIKSTATCRYHLMQVVFHFSSPFLLLTITLFTFSPQCFFTQDTQNK